MGTRGTVLTGPGVQWPLWSCTMRVVTADPHALHAAQRIVNAELAHVESAASRFRRDSELMRVVPGRRTRVSLLLAALLETAMTAAERTDGLVDPTVGSRLAALGYDRDIDQLGHRAPARKSGDARTTTTEPVAPQPISYAFQPAPGWRAVEFDADSRVLLLPPGVVLDLGATAKAWAADTCAWAVHEVTGSPALVSLGGDVATAGGAPDDTWSVLVQDRVDDPAALVALPAGHALTTSSRLSRQWVREGRTISHILDPRTGQAPAPLWRSASVAAPSAVEANTLSTAALADPAGAIGRLAAAGRPARLLDAAGIPVFVGDWPATAEVADPLALAPGGAA